MRVVLAFLLLLALGGVSNAVDFPSCPSVPDPGPSYDPNAHPDAIPCKRIRIFNNHPTDTLWVIIEAGEKKVADEWLQAWFKVKSDEPNRKYSARQVVRIYVNGTTGIPAKSSAEVVLPFYTRLSSSFDGTAIDQFIDWWNGGRVYFYFDALGGTNIQTKRAGMARRRKTRANALMSRASRIGRRGRAPTHAGTALERAL